MDSACRFSKKKLKKRFFLHRKLIYTQESIKRCLVRFDQKTSIFVGFLCAACLPASLIMHVPISELHAQ